MKRIFIKIMQSYSPITGRRSSPVRKQIARMPFAASRRFVKNSVFSLRKHPQFFDFSDYTKSEVNAKLLEISGFLSDSANKYNTSSVKLLGLNTAKEYFGIKWPRYEPVVDRIVQDSIFKFVSTDDLVIRARKTKYMIIFCNLCSLEADAKLAEISQCIADMLFNEDPVFENIQVSTLSDMSRKKEKPKLYSALSESVSDETKVHEIRIPASSSSQKDNHMKTNHIKDNAPQASGCVLGCVDIWGCSSKKVVGQLLYDQQQISDNGSIIANLRTLFRTIPSDDLVKDCACLLSCFVNEFESNQLNAPNRVLLPLSLTMIQTPEFYERLSSQIFEINKYSEVAALVMDVPQACPEKVLEKVVGQLTQFSQHILYESQDMSPSLLETLIDKGEAHGIAFDCSYLKEWTEQDHKYIAEKGEKKSHKMCNIVFGLGNSEVSQSLKTRDITAVGFNLYSCR